MNKARSSVWNINFILLWQGRLVSAIGDVMYNLAVGFFIMQRTNSTMYMSLFLMTANSPMVLYPLAGVLADRLNRKWIMVCTDFVRGSCTLLMALIMFAGFQPLWVLFIASFISNLCTVLFYPAADSSIPDLIEKDELVKANATMELGKSMVNIGANSAAGLLFQLTSGPVLFMVNGIAYIFSAFTELFLKIPRVKHFDESANKPLGARQVIDDLRSGLRFMWHFRGLRAVTVTYALTNLFLCMYMMLLLPHFHRTEALGEARYGVAMSTIALGAALGLIIMTIKPILPKRRINWITLGCLGTLFYAVALFMPFPLMLACFFIGQMLVMFVNVPFASLQQATVPQWMRGKMSSLFILMTNVLTPLGMILGGLIGDVIPAQYILLACMTLSFTALTYLLSRKSTRSYIAFNPKTDNPNDLWARSRRT